MSLFKFPKGLCQDLDNASKNFGEVLVILKVIIFLYRLDIRFALPNLLEVLVFGLTAIIIQLFLLNWVERSFSRKFCFGLMLHELSIFGILICLMLLKPHDFLDLEGDHEKYGHCF
jgi:hypothetical protein